MLHLQHASLQSLGALSLLVFTSRSTLVDEKIAKIAQFAPSGTDYQAWFSRLQRKIASIFRN
jgi:hypothetical protein